MSQFAETGSLLQSLAALERRGVITTDPAEAEVCCGFARDDDGLCYYRPGHPAYVPFPPGQV